MVVLVADADVAAVIESAAAAGVRGWRLGRVAAGSGRVILD
jgi:hypothetical protein